MLATTRPDIVYSLFGGLLTASIAMYILGRVFLKPWIHLVNVPKPHLITGILALIIVGTYGLQFGVFQVYVLLIMGIIGFFMMRYEFSPVATVLGLVLGNLIEQSLRRSLVISDGSWMIFLTRPICLILLLLVSLSVVYPFITEYLGSKKARS